MLKSLFKQSKDGRQTVDAATKQLQIMADSFSAEERRQAASELRNVLVEQPSSKAAISSYGLEIICNAMRNDWKDDLVLRNCLECLSLVVDQSSDQDSKEARVNAEQLARTQGALSLIFDCLEKEGKGIEVFHIKYFSLQILKAVFDTNQPYAQQTSLKVKKAFSSLIGLFKEQEVLRNDALVVLQFIVFGSKSAQDNAVGEKCIEKTFEIFQSEDEQLAAAVIQDCLHLLRYLVEDNPDSQMIFESSGMLKKIICNIKEKARSVMRSDSGISPERSRILASELEMLLPFLISQNVPMDLRAMLKKGPGTHTCELLQIIIPLAHASSAVHKDLAFSATAWDCLAAILRSPALEDNILEVKMPMGNIMAPIPIAALHVCLSSRSPAQVLSSLRFFSSIAWLYPKVQEDALKHVLSVPGLIDNIFESMPDMYSVLQRSRVFLSLAPLCLREGNKDTILSISRKSKSLVALCSEIMATTVLKFGMTPEASSVCLNCTLFLSAAMLNCPMAIKQFLESIKESPFLVGVLLSESQFGDKEKLMKGTCAVLLGMALNAPSSTAINVSLLENAIKDKIGLSIFLAALNFMLEEAANSSMNLMQQDMLIFEAPVPKKFLVNVVASIKARLQPGALDTTITSNGHNGVVPCPQVDVPLPGAQIIQENIEPSFHTPLESSEDKTRLKNENRDLKQQLTVYNEKLKEAEQKINKLESELGALSEAYACLESHSSHLRQEVERLEKEKQDRDAETDAAMEDLLVCLGEEEEKVKTLRAQLEALGVQQLS